MKIIHKYPIPGHVFVPEYHQILKVAYQNDSLYVWILVDPDQEKETCLEFILYGTGWTMLDNYGSYIDSVLTKEGLVYHIFIANKTYYFKRGVSN